MRWYYAWERTPDQVSYESEKYVVHGIFQRLLQQSDHPSCSSYHRTLTPLPSSCGIWVDFWPQWIWCCATSVATAWKELKLFFLGDICFWNSLSCCEKLRESMSILKWLLYTTKFGMFVTQHSNWNKMLTYVGQNLGIWSREKAGSQRLESSC